MKKETEDKILRLVEKRQNINSEIKGLQEEVKEITNKIVTAMGKSKIKTLANDFVQATRVAPEKVTYNQAKFKKNLSPKLYKKITKEVLDMDALAACVQSGEISSEILDKCSDVEETTPYLKVTVKKTA